MLSQWQEDRDDRFHPLPREFFIGCGWALPDDVLEEVVFCETLTVLVRDWQASIQRLVHCLTQLYHIPILWDDVENSAYTNEKAPWNRIFQNASRYFERWDRATLIERLVLLREELHYLDNCHRELSLWDAHEQDLKTRTGRTRTDLRANQLFSPRRGDGVPEPEE